MAARRCSRPGPRWPPMTRTNVMSGMSCTSVARCRGAWSAVCGPCTGAKCRRGPPGGARGGGPAATGAPAVQRCGRPSEAGQPRGGYIRILFAFDPRRTAILLIGGDMKSQWTTWYKQMVPVADQLYDDHLQELKREGKGS